MWHNLDTHVQIIQITTSTLHWRWTHENIWNMGTTFWIVSKMFLMHCINPLPARNNAALIHSSTKTSSIDTQLQIVEWHHKLSLNYWCCLPRLELEFRRFYQIKNFLRHRKWRISSPRLNSGNLTQICSGWMPFQDWSSDLKMTVEVQLKEDLASAICQFSFWFSVVLGGFWVSRNLETRNLETLKESPGKASLC